MKNFYNMNHEDIFLSQFPCGRFVVKIKLGHKYYFLEIKKDVGVANLCLYVSKKYVDNIVLGIFVRKDRMITRKFLEALPELEKAQRLIYSWTNDFVRI